MKKGKRVREETNIYIQDASEDVDLAEHASVCPSMGRKNRETDSDVRLCGLVVLDMGPLIVGVFIVNGKQKVYERKVLEVILYLCDKAVDR